MSQGLSRDVEVTYGACHMCSWRSTMTTDSSSRKEDYLQKYVHVCSRCGLYDRKNRTDDQGCRIRDVISIASWKEGCRLCNRQGRFSSARFRHRARCGRFKMASQYETAWRLIFLMFFSTISRILISSSFNRANSKIMYRLVLFSLAFIGTNALLMKIYRVCPDGNFLKNISSNECFREGLLLGMGNPLLDISAYVDHKFLQKYNLKSNNAILAEDKHKPLYEELINSYNADFTAGGSVQNTMRVAQWLLQKPKITTYMGCVGRDRYSKILENKATADGLNIRYQYTDQEPTGTCAVLITGKERSLCANLAAANCFSPSHIETPENKHLIDIARYVYISGFFLTVSPESIQTVAKRAYENDKIFMMNLSAPFLCEFFQKPMLAAFPYVDILFGNETEADAFAKANNLNTTDRKLIAKKISEMEKISRKRKRIVVITQGAEAVLLAKDGEVTEYPVVKLPEEKVVDTNAAGDAFVGGFLAQLIQGKSIDVCIKCGIWAATQIVQKSGCTYEGKPSFQS